MRSSSPLQHRTDGSKFTEDVAQQFPGRRLPNSVLVTRVQLHEVLPVPVESLNDGQQRRQRRNTPTIECLSDRGVTAVG